jgi:hypothetical protein
MAGVAHRRAEDAALTISRRWAVEAPLSNEFMHAPAVTAKIAVN